MCKVARARSGALDDPKTPYPPIHPNGRGHNCLVLPHRRRLRQPQPERTALRVPQAAFSQEIGTGATETGVGSMGNKPYVLDGLLSWLSRFWAASQQDCINDGSAMERLTPRRALGTAVTSIHRAAESIYHRKPVYSPPQPYPIGSGLSVFLGYSFGSSPCVSLSEPPFLRSRHLSSHQGTVSTGPRTTPAPDSSCAQKGFNPIASPTAMSTTL